ncbi:MAG: hypothetical protein U0401_24320 [Anaerolineae bacterium]
MAFFGDTAHMILPGVAVAYLLAEAVRGAVVWRVGGRSVDLAGHRRYQPGWSDWRRYGDWG